MTVLGFCGVLSTDLGRPSEIIGNFGVIAHILAAVPSHRCRRSRGELDCHDDLRRSRMSGCLPLARAPYLHGLEVRCPGLLNAR